MIQIKNIASFDVFCNVIDNFGDLGFCLRLSMDLSSLGYQVSLYCDSIETFNKIKPKNLLEKHNRLNILKWDNKLDYKASDVVILAFSCHISDKFLEEIKNKRSTVINLEYLSAEKFVESCHMRPSLLDNLNAYFFFPGVTDKTGGVICEDFVASKINNYIKDNIDKKNERVVSVFSYENKEIQGLIKAFLRSKKHTILNVFVGKSLDNINTLLNINLKENDTYSFENITINAVAMTDIRSYDDILLKSDLNLVRGEDSIVRAMLFGKAFLWQIYIQDEDTHIIKLNAMLDRIEEILAKDACVDFASFRELLNSYNGNGDFIENLDIDKEEENMQKIANLWSLHLRDLNSLTKNLIAFCQKVQS